MDPLSALSVAGTVVQLVGYGTKLLSSSVELYKSSSGALNTHEELELMTADLRSVVTKLRSASVLSLRELPGTSATGINSLGGLFYEICDKAAQVADDLLDKLKGLKLEDGKNRVWKSLKVALKAALSKEEIASLKQRLSALQGSLHSGSMLLLVQKISASTAQSLTRHDSLHAQTQQILATLSSKASSKEIIDAVTELCCRIDTVNHSEHHKTHRMIADLINRVGPSSIIAARTEMLHVLTQQEKDFRESIKKRLLQELAYPCMTSRYEEILEAYPETFDWIFSNVEQEDCLWSDFRNWLQKDEGIYWINGKAGSGKSTLMKHIYDDPRTSRFLRSWVAKDQPKRFRSCIASFFFWNSGTTLQQSQQGLLRSLLFQILRQNTDLIPIVFPTRWAELYSETSPDIAEQIVPEWWSLRQLHDAFKKLVAQEEYPLKMCFLIDGLDEFRGDAEELCLFFKELSEVSDNAKYCLSSRPWTQFQQSFEGCASLRLQDLTANDIKTFVNDKFHRSPSFRKLATRDAKLASSLAREIVERAEGVFLWVDIAVRLLLRGTSNNDTIPQLWSRLRSFPRELYPLYNAILLQIEPLYLEWASKAFQIMKLSTRLSSDPFEKLDPTKQTNTSRQREALHEDGVDPMTLMQLTVALHEDRRFSAIDDEVSAVELSTMCAETESQITARCAGLLEVASSQDRKGKRSCYSIPYIRWMHRTARDFLEKNPKWVEDFIPPGFSPAFSMMKSLIFCCSDVQALSSRQGLSDYLVSVAALKTSKYALIYAYHANGDPGSRKIRTRLLCKLMNTGVMSFESTEELPHVEKFLHRATMYCLSDFVEDILSAKCPIIQLQASGILVQRLCGHEPLASPGRPFPTVRMVTSLIKMGKFFPRRISEPPCEDEGEGLPGVGKMYLVYHSGRINFRAVPRFVESQLAIIEAFLKYGVDPTDSLSFIPRGFILPKKALQAAVEEHFRDLMEDDLELFPVLVVLEKALREEVRAHERRKDHSMMKRKRAIRATSGGIATSDEIASGNAVAWGE